MFQFVMWNRVRGAAEGHGNDEISNHGYHGYKEFVTHATLLIWCKWQVLRIWVLGKSGWKCVLNWKCHFPIWTVSFTMSAPANNVYVDRLISPTFCYQHKEQSQCGKDLVKVEIQVKINYGLSCKDFYVFQNVILGAVVICKIFL